MQAQSTGQVQQSRAGDLLYVVDGKVIGQRATLDAAALGVNVGRITVLSPAAARARYGEPGANGAVVIITRRQVQTPNPPVLNRPRARDTVRVEAVPIVVAGVPVDTARVMTAVRPQYDSGRIELRARETPAPVTGTDPVIIIDGVRQTPARPLIVIDGQVFTGGQNDLRLIDPATIDRIEVLKGEAALRMYGERARDGAIIITLKRD
jgi:outer membrane receptor protein involved in Fe transport